MVEDISFEAPAFSEGENQRFEFDGSGTIVLAFFPGAFTGPCTEEMCNFRDQMSEFKDLDTEVIGISVDTPFALEEFATQNDLEFALVSDQNAEIAEQYGVQTEFPGLGHKIAERAVFIVQDDEVVYSEVMDDPHNLPDFEALKRELEDL